ncbi:phylloplanin [Eutrema salsugineum]|nr:phylloplanin [Eutrema salsugineum]
MAMLKNKNITFSLILMCLIVVSPMAKAQIGGLGGLGGLLGLLNVINIQGLVRCSISGTVSTSNATSVPPFPNAGIVLRCAGQNVSITTTNAAGIFSLPTTQLLNVLPTLLSGGCNILVTTPLSTCNASLPTSGSLTAPLNIVGSNFAGGLNIIEIVSGLFSLVP